MGDKSPKANLKKKAQQKAKANSAAQKKEVGGANRREVRPAFQRSCRALALAKED
jgi:hypothetical protein